MHPRILTARNQAAMESIAASARRIAVALGREPEGIFEGTWVRDPECRALFEREAVDRFLVTVAEGLESGMRPSRNDEAALAELRSEIERLTAEAESQPCSHPWDQLRWQGDETKLICAACGAELDPDAPMAASVEQDGEGSASEESTEDDEPSRNAELWAQLPPNAREALEAAGITSAAEVAGMTDEALLSINGIGKKTVGAVRQLIPAFDQE